MISGWNDEKHYMLFSKEDAGEYMKDPIISKYMKNYEIIGLLGWDDFILKKKTYFYTVPTVPIDFKYLEKIDFDPEISLEKTENKIKWYSKPIIFSGDPEDETNMTWIDSGDHIKLVSYWNKMYYSMK